MRATFLGRKTTSRSPSAFRYGGRALGLYHVSRKVRQDRFTSAAAGVCAALMFGMSPASLRAVVIDSTYIGATGGNWSVDTNWDPQLVPNNNGDTFNVTVGAETVIANGAFEIDALNVGTGVVEIEDFFTLTINADSTIDGTLQIAQTFNGILYIGDDLTLGGTGRVLMQGSQASDIAGVLGAETLTIGPDFSIVADGPFTRGSLQLDTNNQGAIGVTGGAVFFLQSIVLDNTGGGTVSVEQASELTMNGTFVSGGTIDGGASLTSGRIDASNGATFDSVAIAGNAEINVFNLNLIGTTTSDGVLVLANAGGGNRIITIQGGHTLDGDGGVEFRGTSSNRLVAATPGDTLTIEADSSVRAVGINANGLVTADIDNHGLVGADGGTLGVNDATLTVQNNDFTNDGTVRASNGGRVSFSGVTFDHNDSIDVVGDSQIDFTNSTVNLNDGNTLTGLGTLAFGSGATVVATGATTNNRVTALAGGSQLRANGTAVIGGAGTLAAVGNVNINPHGVAGTDVLVIGPNQSLAVAAPGTVNLNVPVTIDGSMDVTNGTANINAPLTNNNQINLQNLGQLAVNADLLGAGLIHLDPGKQLTINSSVTIDNAIHGGTVSIPVLGETATFTNADFDVDQTTLNGNATWTQKPARVGELTVGNNATASFPAGLDSTDTITVNGILSIDAPSTHSGELNWFGTISGTGTFTQQSPFTLGFSTLDGATFNADDHVTATGPLTIINGGVFHNNAGDTFEIADLAQAINGDGLFQNNGRVFRSATSGQFIIRADFQQTADGVTDVTEDIAIGGDSTSEGGFNVGGDAGIIFTNDPNTSGNEHTTHTVDANVTGSGMVVVDGKDFSGSGASSTQAAFNGGYNITGPGSGTFARFGATIVFNEPPDNVGETLGIERSELIINVDTLPQNDNVVLGPDEVLLSDGTIASSATVNNEAFINTTHATMSGELIADVADTSTFTTQTLETTGSSDLTIDGWNLNAQDDCSLGADSHWDLKNGAGVNLNCQATADGDVTVTADATSIFKIESLALNGGTFSITSQADLGQFESPEGHATDLDANGFLYLELREKAILEAKLNAVNLGISIDATDLSPAAAIVTVDFDENQAKIDAFGEVVTMDLSDPDGGLDVQFTQNDDCSDCSFQPGDLTAIFDPDRAINVDGVNHDGVYLDSAVMAVDGDGAEAVDIQKMIFNTGNTPFVDSVLKVASQELASDPAQLRIVVTARGDLYVLTDGRLDLNEHHALTVEDGSMTNDGLVTGGTLSEITIVDPTGLTNNGTLAGSLTVAANVTNNGTVSPGQSPGIISVMGEFEQTPDGFLEMEIGDGELDQLHVTGTITLAGLLNVSLLDNFAPGPLDFFPIIHTDTQILGEFLNLPSSARVDTTDGRGSFQIFYGPASPFDPNSVVLTDFIPVPEPTSLSLLILGAALMHQPRRSTRTPPRRDRAT